MITRKPGAVAANQYLADVNALTSLVAIPPTFDPLTEPAATLPGKLSAFNLPAKPDPATQADVHAFWQELFSPPLTFVSGPLSYPVLPATPPPSPKQPPPRQTRSQSRQQSSNNWSGASLVARDGRMFTDVMAKFVTPNVNPPPGAIAGTDLRCSCWVGLDGQRSYPDATLPQIGVELSFDKVGEPPGSSIISWFQWWPMTVMLIPQATVPVAFGDTVYCWLTALSYTQVRAIIKVVNRAGTVGTLMRIVANAPPTRFTFPPQRDYVPEIAGATAEWVTEAPSDIVTQVIFPLPDYGTVTFEKCIALSALAPLGQYRSEPLIGPKTMNIYNVVDGRRQTISRGDRLVSVATLDSVVTTYTPRTP